MNGHAHLIGSNGQGRSSLLTLLRLFEQVGYAGARSSLRQSERYVAGLVNVKNVPSMGYTVLRIVAGTKAASNLKDSDLKIDGLTMENTNLRVTVDSKTGCIISLFDKHANFESLANGACGNQLQTFKDTPKDYDAWNIDPGTLDHNTPIDSVDSVELIEKGPLRAVIRVSRTWQSSKFVQDITLYAGADQVDVVNDVEWHETHVLLKAAFPLAATSNHATYEIPFGSIERATTRNNSWEKAQFEVPAQRWADLGDGQHGFSLINDSKFGYDDQDNVLRLTLLRSPTWPDPEADRANSIFCSVPLNTFLSTVGRSFTATRTLSPGIA